MLLKKLSALLVSVTLAVGLQAAGQLPVALGSAATYSVLAGSTVTNTGFTAENGNIGVSPGSAVTGFPPGSVVNGAIHRADGSSALAQTDLTAAYLDAMNRPTPIVIAGDLGGQTLAPGLYKSSTSIGITGILKLDGQGNVNSVFIFQIGSTLTTASTSQIVLIGGAQAANIFWQLGSSATLGTNSIFHGTIMAQDSITLTTGVALDGRALARTGAVTLDTNNVVNPGLPTGSGPPGALTVSCPASNAQLNVPYSSLIAASGGTPPYTFSTTGSLPAGLTLTAASGAVTGTPTALGATAFSANAADSATGTATSACTITVTAGPPPATPAPSSLILVLIGFTLMMLYVSRERVLGRLRKNS
jgi:Ice-binding-like/Putative Ig domain